VTGAPVLHGRDAELRRLRSLLSAARSGEGGCLVVRGEAGMGKTALLSSLASDDLVWLAIRGVRAERSLPFAALDRLLPEADVSGSPLRVRRRAHERLTGLAASAPVLCTVDDAQWVDAESLDVLGFVARRLSGNRVAMVVAGRPELVAPAGTSAMWLGPLPDSACEALLADRPVPAGLRAALRDLAGGNPLDLVALAESLTPEQRAGRAPLPDELPEGPRRAALGSQLAALSPPGLVLLLCAAAESTVDFPLLSRLGDVTEVVESGLLGVAGTALRLPSKAVRSTLYALAPPVARREAHALLASVLTGPRGTWHRALAEPGSSAALADELAAAATATDPLTSATILERAAMLTIHKGLRASRLLAAARQAWQAGRPGRARVLLSRADGADEGEVALLHGEMELRDGEPAVATHELTTAAAHLRDPASWASALLLAGEARRLSGDLRGYHDLAHSLPKWAPTQPAPDHAESRQPASLPRIGLFDRPGGASGKDPLDQPGGAPGKDSLDRPGGASGKNPPSRLEGPPRKNPPDRLEGPPGKAPPGGPPEGLTEPPPAGPTTPRTPPPSPGAPLSASLPEISPGQRGRAGLWTTSRCEWSTRTGELMLAHFAGLTATFAGRHADAAAPLRRVVELAADETGGVAEAVWAAEAACALGRGETAYECASAAVSRARLSGRESLLPWALVHLSLAAIVLDRHPAAHAASTEGLAAAAAAAQRNTWIEHLSLLALSAALRGDPAALSTLDTAAPGIAERGLGRPCVIASWARACLDLADDRPADALGRLEAMAAGVSGAQPAIQVLATPQLVEAAVLVEQPDRARRALAVFDGWVHAGGSEAWLALSHRCHGLLDAEHHFDTAIALHRTAGAAMELARTQLAYAHRLRRTRRARAARGQFREALRVFETVGAARWADRARAGLRAAGEQIDSDASVDGLTPQQAEISRLVAVGETNKEIARRLVISHRTVDHHLRNIFTALGVRSRVELARRVAGLK
jgi:DNA-binding CsgD family transcriptional regulator